MGAMSDAIENANDFSANAQRLLANVHGVEAAEVYALLAISERLVVISSTLSSMLKNLQEK